MVISVFLLMSCKNYNASDEFNFEEAKILINNYLNALSNKNLDEISQYATPELIKQFNEETINNLKDSLESARLIEAEIREKNSEKIIIDAKVEVKCYENFIPTGDWVPGTTISIKSFELIHINDKWKVNGWGIY